MTIQLVAKLALASTTSAAPLKPMAEKIIPVVEALNCLPRIAQLLQQGGVIALPTDTIYGVACSVQCPLAIKRIQQLKGRSSAKPMAICVDKVDVIPHWCDTSDLPPGLLHSLLPGPVTLLLRPRSSSTIHSNSQYGQSAWPLCGVRVPNYGLVRSVVTALSDLDPQNPTGHPLVLTSANPSGDTSTLSVQEFSSIWTHLDLIVDGGPIEASSTTSAEGDVCRAGSTIVDLTQAQDQIYRIVRDGSALQPTVAILEQQFGMHRAES